MPTATQKPTPVPPSQKRSSRSTVPAPATGHPKPLETKEALAEPPTNDPVVSTGQASYYALSMTGHPTASGQPFNNDELLGAHRSFALGSMVRVTNLANGNSAVVRIVYRGPYAPGRVIHVSRSAAKQLDMLRAGVVDVKLELLPGKPNVIPELK